MRDNDQRRLPGRWAAAVHAAARGWPVFPVRPYTKRPAVVDWEHQATCDPQVIADWWRHAPYNVGIACGPAGLVVLDLDMARDQEPPPAVWADRGARNGPDVLALLAADHGADLAATFTVATPSGGQHRYHQAPAVELRNSVGVLGWRIDVRAAGGYVLAAGSALRVDGHPRYYTPTTNVEPAPLPDWITATLTPPEPATHPPPAPPPDGTRRQAWIHAAVTGETTTVAHARVGRRNHTLFVAACRLGELVGAGLLDPTTAEAALTEAATVHHGIDGFTADEAVRTITNGLTRGRAHPREAPSNLL